MTQFINELRKAQKIKPDEVLQKRNEYLEKAFKAFMDSRLCKICMDNEASIAFHCGHLISCGKCVQALKNCPICRKPVKAKIKMFLDWDLKLPEAKQ